MAHETPQADAGSTPEVVKALIVRAKQVAGQAFETGYECGRGKTRVIATDDGLVDGAEFARLRMELALGVAYAEAVGASRES